MKQENSLGMLFRFYPFQRIALFCWLTGLSFGNPAFSYETGTQNALLQKYSPAIEEWVLQTTIDNVECYYKIVNCKGKNTVFLKFVNKNNYKVQIQWNELFDTQAEKKVQGIFGNKKLKIAPSQMIAADCNSPTINKECIVLSNQVSPAYEADIKGFEFSNIVISKQS